MAIMHRGLRRSIVTVGVVVALVMLPASGALAAPAPPTDQGPESGEFLQCFIQAFLQFQPNASVTYSANGTSCTPGFTGTIAVRLDGPGVSPGEELEAPCTASGTCSTASATVPCMDGQGYSGLVELFDSAGNSINTGSTFGTCQHCGTAQQLSSADPCDQRSPGAGQR